MLNKNWYFEKPDLEYQKYLVLAYLQEVETNFKQNKLYPYLNELLKLYNDGSNFIDHIESIHDGNKIITGLDIKKLELRTEDAIGRVDVFENIKSALFFALPKFSNFIKEGQEIENKLNKYICLDCLGLSPVDTNNGIFTIQDKTNWFVYKYEIDGISITDKLKIEFLEQCTLSPETIKEEYQNKSKDIISFYSAHAFGVHIPVEETMFHIVRKKLIKILYK